MKRIGWLAFLIAVITLAGCNNSGKNQNSTDLRVVNAVVDAEALDVLIDDNVQFTAIPFQSTSPYSEFGSGTKTVKVRSSVNGTILSQKSAGLNSAATNTLLIYGKRASMVTSVIADDTTDASSGTFKIRVADVSAEAGIVDLYVSSADISSAPSTIPGAAFGGVSDFSEVTAGSYTLTLAVSGTKQVVFQAPARTFTAGTKLTFVVLPSGGGLLANAILLDGSSGTFLPNSLARVKAVNAVPDAPGLTFKADTETLLASVPFAGASSYVATNAATRNLQLEASNVPGVAIASSSQQLKPASDYTVAAVGTLAAPQLAFITDDNSLPAASAARMRFVNLRSDPSPVDVLVNFASQATGLAFKSASGYISLPAGTTTTYTVTFATAGGVSVVTSLDTGPLDVGAVYTAYLFGGAGGPQARLVRDR